MKHSKQPPRLKSLARRSVPQPYCGLYEVRPNPANPTRGEQAVWRSVLTQALTDALSLSAKRCSRRAQREALAWLTHFGRDFRLVCDYAGYDAAYVFQKIQQLLHKRGLVEAPKKPLKRLLKSAPSAAAAPAPTPTQFGLSARLPSQKLSPLLGLPYQLLKPQEDKE